MTNFTIGQKYVTNPRSAWTGVEKIALDVSGADGVGLASTLKTYVNNVNRIKLAANVTYNVATTGNDTTGDGSVGLPWASPQHAWNWVCDNIDINGWKVTIQIAAGTYGPPTVGASVLDLTSKTPVHLDTWGNAAHGGRVTFLGQSDRTLVKLAGAAGSSDNQATVWSYLVNQPPLEFQNMQVTAVDVPCFWLETTGSEVVFTNVDIGGGTGYQLWAINSPIQIYGNYTLLTGGTPSYHMRASQGAVVEYYAAVHIPSDVTFTGGFFLADLDGFIGWQGTCSAPDAARFHGSPYVVQGGHVDFQGSGRTLSAIPGDDIGFIAWTVGVTNYLGSEGLYRGASLPTEFMTEITPTTADVIPEAFAFAYNSITHAVGGYYNDDGTILPVLRERLQANRTYYVRAGGSNSNSGLSNTDAHAWATQVYAVDFINRFLDLNEYTITLQVNSVTVMTYGGNQAITKVGLPSTAEVPPSGFAVMKNSADSNIYLAYNDAGSIKTAQFGLTAPTGVTSGRTQLNGNFSYYVATTGNDSTGTGLIGAPWASPQKAWNYISANLDLNGFTVAVNIAAGTYQPLVANTPVLDLTSTVVQGGGLVNFVGQASRTAVRFYQPSASEGRVVQVGRGQYVQFDRIQMFATAGSGGSMLGGDGPGSLLQFNDCDVGPGPACHFFAGDYTAIGLDGTYSILGGTAQAHIRVGQIHAVVTCVAHVDIPAPITIGSGFLDGFLGTYGDGQIYIYTSFFTNTGNLTCPKYYVEGGVIHCYAAFFGDVANLASIPGSSPGVGVRSGQADIEPTTGSLDFLFGNRIGFNVMAGLPTANYLDPSCWGVFKNTSDGKLWLIANDAGSFKKVELT